MGLRYYLDAMGERLVKVDGGGDHNAGDNFNIWILADKDDVLSDGYFEQPHIVLKSDYARITPSSTGNSIDIVSGRRYYLALIGSYWGYDAVDEYYNYYGWSERDYYGWVELEASKAGLDIVSSAFSYSPLIVGGGLAPIPEPSAGVLLLLGLSALALRRRE